MTPRRWIERLAVPGLLGAALAAAALRCSDFEGLSAPATQALGEGGCTLAHPPSPPVLVATPGTAKVEFTAVAWQADLGFDDSLDGGLPPYQTTGFDLDDSCTSAAAGATCREPGWATASHVDGPGGIDNAIGANQYTLNRMVMDAGSGTQLLAGLERQGTVQLAIRVRGYDETKGGVVDVSYYAVTLHRADDAGAQPKYDGTDAWDVYTPWLQPPDSGTWDVDRPLFDDPNAYITTGRLDPVNASPTVLVSHLSGLTVGGWPPFHLSGVVMTAEVVRAGASWTLSNVVFGGREGADDYVHHLVTVRDPADPTHFLCKGRGAYALAHDFTCSFVDIQLDGGDDGSGECDALSWGWRYRAGEPVAGRLGIGPDALPEIPTDCPPDASPIYDRCAP